MSERKFPPAVVQDVSPAVCPDQNPYPSPIQPPQSSRLRLVETREDLRDLPAWLLALVLALLAGMLCRRIDEEQLQNRT